MFGKSCVKITLNENQLKIIINDLHRACGMLARKIGKPYCDDALTNERITSRNAIADYLTEKLKEVSNG